MIEDETMPSLQGTVMAQSYLIGVLCKNLPAEIRANELVPHVERRLHDLELKIDVAKRAGIDWSVAVFEAEHRILQRTLRDMAA